MSLVRLLIDIFLRHGRMSVSPLISVRRVVNRLTIHYIRRIYRPANSEFVTSARQIRESIDTDYGLECSCLSLEIPVRSRLSACAIVRNGSSGGRDTDGF